jgi:tRNA A-37 threonylcarbamoyl transferase component Bud32
MATDVSGMKRYLHSLLHSDDVTTLAAVRSEMAGMLPYELGPYRLERLLGAGANGAVFEAYHTALERRSAVKVLLSEWLVARGRTEQLDLRARSRADAVEQARIQATRHPHIVQVHDVRVVDDVVVIEMEHVEGQTLWDIIHDRGPLGVAEATAIVLQVADALNDCHRRGRIHGDLSWANVMLTRDHEVKVLDFGGSHALGTPGFGAPEQRAQRVLEPEGSLAARGPATEQSDRFAIGTLLYRLVSGDTTSGDGVGLSPEQARRVPRSLRPIVRRCREAQPSLRYGSTAELGCALTAVLRKRALARQSLMDAALCCVVLLGLMMGRLYYRVEQAAATLTNAASADLPAIFTSMEGVVLGADDYTFCYRRGLAACFHQFQRELVGKPLPIEHPRHEPVQRLWECGQEGCYGVLYLWEKPSFGNRRMPKVGVTTYVAKHDLMVGSGWYVDDFLQYLVGSCLLLAIARRVWAKARTFRQGFLFCLAMQGR